MTTARLETFSDGVIAILITIMVLELKVPHGATVAAFREVVPTLLLYVLSFAYLGIYWNNHHHMLHLVEHVNGRILWANLHLMFWLSLVPFATSYMGENDFAPLPTAVYGVVLWLAACAWLILQREIIKEEGAESKLALALGRDAKGIISATLYAIAVVMAFVATWVSYACYIIVALTWLVPDRRFERRAREGSQRAGT